MFDNVKNVKACGGNNVKAERKRKEKRNEDFIFRVLGVVILAIAAVIASSFFNIPLETIVNAILRGAVVGGIIVLTIIGASLLVFGRL